MNRQLTGLAWIFFGILLVLIELGNGIWIPIIDDIPGDLMKFAALVCGVIGLVLAAKKPKEKD